MRKKKYGERLASCHDLSVIENVSRATIINPPTSHGMMLPESEDIKLSFSSSLGLSRVKIITNQISIATPLIKKSLKCPLSDPFSLLYWPGGTIEFTIIVQSNSMLVL